MHPHEGFFSGGDNFALFTNALKIRYVNVLPTDIMLYLQCLSVIINFTLLYNSLKIKICFQTGDHIKETT